MAEPDLTPRFEIKCACGWTQVFSRGYSGLIIECGQCGKNHRIPMVGQNDAEASAEALRVMKPFLETRPYGEPAQQATLVATVYLKPMFVLSAIVVVLSAVFAAIFYHDKPWPMAVVIVGGAASWPLGLFVAWLGQRRQARAGREQG
ncbi:MAG: hypothetical protein KF754_11945 [Planctomycetes bacterium]|nr:hypothetical protein [Planctomycetota bacterium]